MVSVRNTFGRLGRVAIATAVAGSTCIVGAAAARAAAPLPYVVILREGMSATQVAADAHAHKAAPSHTYTNVISGYSAQLTSAQVAGVQADPNVVMVVPDKLVARIPLRSHGSASRQHPNGPIGNNHQPAGNPVTSYRQFIPTALERVFLQDSRLANVNRHGPGVDAGIAIIDSGISPNPDLNVADGVNCTGDPNAGLADDVGHGTEVAGVAAAIDNRFGVVGTAPGARLYNVKISENGDIATSSILCGLDWVIAHRHAIDVANMSFEDTGDFTNDNDCGLQSHDPFHYAVCKANADGITLVTGAGNDGRHIAEGMVPQAYAEVINTGGYQDTDGIPGGKGSACGDGFGDADDQWAAWSNFGGQVDLMAVADCEQVIANNGTIEWDAGTSFASPAVAGAAADLAARFPRMTPSDIQQYLETTALHRGLGDNPHHYGLLNMAAL